MTEDIVIGDQGTNRFGLDSRHEPAKDALLHLGVVEPVAAGGPTVQIASGCVPPGIPAPEADVRSTLTPPPKPSSEGD